MAETLNAHQLIQLAQSLTQMQSAITDFELRHYTNLSEAQKSKIEKTLSQLAIAAGRMYAFSVQLKFQDVQSQLAQLQQASEGLKKFLRTVRGIQEVLDTISSVASFAGAIISHDVEGITAGIDQILQLVANN